MAGTALGGSISSSTRDLAYWKLPSPSTTTSYACRKCGNLSTKSVVISKNPNDSLSFNPSMPDNRLRSFSWAPMSRAYGRFGTGKPITLAAA